MLTIDTPAHEARLRRLAARQGLHLRKSRRRDPNVYDYGAYGLVDVQTNCLVAGGDSRLAVDEVEGFLTA